MLRWLLLAVPFALAWPAVDALAFCGFYVAKADTKLFNKSSQVVIARDGERTVVTMVNDFKGEPSEFAVVIPVPTFLEEGQIHVGERAVVDHLDAYTAPRLVEYFDADPCRRIHPSAALESERAFDRDGRKASRRARTLGVAIEASYTVGEYDIQILSAAESDGLETFLREQGYALPDGAAPILGSYLKQGMRFFVAKVNLEEHARRGFSSLRPLQIAYASRKFMLPIRLGTVNAEGAQELFVYTLTRRGRVETTNYRTLRLPSDRDVPVHVKAEFGDFYRAMFSEQARRQSDPVVFLEYAWDMNWCDPCAADPLSRDELRQLGVFWLDGSEGPGAGRAAPAAQDVFVTRLHLRYDAERFPEDLRFQETGDRTNFQGRFVLRHAYRGAATCPEAERYRQSLAERREREAQNLANLTGWKIEEIRQRIAAMFPNDAGPGAAGRPWWEKLWRRSGS